jgi:hypothetical protein
VATETTETKTDERGPLLDLQEITAKRDYIIGPDGETYFLHTEGLSAIDHHRLTHCVERHDELFAKKPEDMTAAEAKELSAVTDEMLGLVLEAPARSGSRSQVRRRGRSSGIFREGRSPTP